MEGNAGRAHSADEGQRVMFKDEVAITVCVVVLALALIIVVWGP